jgi:hypothetical protein
MADLISESQLGVPRLLTDKRYRAWVTSKLTDPVLSRFWTHEFETLTPALQREASLPILNKVGQFLMAPPLRHIVGQVKPKLDFTEIMDDSGIFIANLAKGVVLCLSTEDALLYVTTRLHYSPRHNILALRHFW